MGSRVRVSYAPQHHFQSIFLTLYGALVQLVRIHACHAWGHEFESRTHRRKSFRHTMETFFLPLKVARGTETTVLLLDTQPSLYTWRGYYKTGMQTIVGRWSPRPVLPVITYFACWSTWRGGHRPTIVCKAIHSPLPRGGGSRVSGAGEGLLQVYVIFLRLFRSAFVYKVCSWCKRSR